MGESSITAIINDSFDSWNTLSITGDLPDMTLVQTENTCKVSSKTSLGNIKVTGSNDWNEVTLNSIVTDNVATVLELKEQFQAPKLVLQTEDGVTIDSISAVYSVVYMTRGGSFVDAVTQIPYGVTINAPTNPSYDGHVFGGWYKDSSCSTGQEWNFSTDTVTEDIVLYAKWVKADTTQPVTPPIVPNYNNDNKDNDNSNPVYNITIPGQMTGGTVKVSPTSASIGNKVTITAKPNSGYEVRSVTVTDKNGKEITVTDVGDGKYTFTMPASKVMISATFVEINAPSTAATMPVTVNFTDVPSGAYYYDAVSWAVEKGITAGTTATTFSPNDPCTRAQIVTFLWRAADSPVISGNSPFTDVAPDSYYYDAVAWAVAKGITAGTSATTFSPNDTCTRGQAVTFLYRAAGSPTASGNNTFTDVAGNAYYSGAVQWAVDKGVTAGTSATTFSPNDNCTRAQIVTFLYRDRAN